MSEPDPPDATPPPDAAPPPDPTQPPEQDASVPTGMPRCVKAVALVALIVISVVVLFTWIFPWVESNLQNPTMGSLLLTHLPLT